MPRLSIQAFSNTLPPEALTSINTALQALVRTVDIDFADTGFFERTPFAKVEILQNIAEDGERTIQFKENNEAGILTVSCRIAAAECAKDHELLQDAVMVLAAIAEKYELNPRAFTIRAFHMKGQVLRSKFENAQRPESIDFEPYHSETLPAVIPVKRYVQSYSKYIGKYADGNQFWGQVVATFRKPSNTVNDGAVGPDEWKFRKCWYAVLHKFDATGRHLETKHKFMGTDGETGVLAEAEREMKNFIKSLGRVRYGDIAIGLFSVEIDGSTFGMVETSSKESGDQITMEPGDLVFYPPWNGDYDT